MVTIAQIGCGYWGPNLLRNFVQNRDCEVKYVYDVDDKRLEYVKQVYSQMKVTKRFEDILEDNSIDAVVIATPAKTHFELSMQLIRSGKHIFVEKPLALSTSEVKEIIDCAEDNKRIVMVGHTFMYNSAVEVLKNYINNGDLGEIYYVYSQRLNLGKIRDDVNAMWNLAIHDISILLYVLNSTPVSVFANGFSYIQEKIEDVVFLTISFKDNSVAHIHTSWLDPHKVRKMTFVGSKKMIVYDDSSDSKIQIFDKGIDKKNIGDSLGEFDNFGKFQLIHRAGDIYIPKISFTEPLKTESSHFIDCIMNNKKPLSDAYNGLQVVAILEAAQKSLENRGEETLIDSM